jgi:hypothetical protein
MYILAGKEGEPLKCNRVLFCFVLFSFSGSLFCVSCVCLCLCVCLLSPYIIHTVLIDTHFYSFKKYMHRETHTHPCTHTHTHIYRYTHTHTRRQPN